jgi:hypothetical protein
MPNPFRHYQVPSKSKENAMPTPSTPTKAALLEQVDEDLTKLWVMHKLGQNRGEERSYRPFDHVLDRRLEIMKAK